MKKVSLRTVQISIDMARSIAGKLPMNPFLADCADLMEQMMNEIKELRKQNAVRK
jgi:hypothetical protein